MYLTWIILGCVAIHHGQAAPQVAVNTTGLPGDDLQDWVAQNHDAWTNFLSNDVMRAYPDEIDGGGERDRVVGRRPTGRQPHLQSVPLPRHLLEQVE